MSYWGENIPISIWIWMSFFLYCGYMCRSTPDLMSEPKKKMNNGHIIHSFGCQAVIKEKAANFSICILHPSLKQSRSHWNKHRWVNPPLVEETYYYKEKSVMMFLLDADRSCPLNILKCDHHKIETNILCGFNNRAYWHIHLCCIA